MSARVKITDLASFKAYADLPGPLPTWFPPFTEVDDQVVIPPYEVHCRVKRGQEFCNHRVTPAQSVNLRHHVEYFHRLDLHPVKPGKLSSADHEKVTVWYNELMAAHELRDMAPVDDDVRQEKISEEEASCPIVESEKYVPKRKKTPMERAKEPGGPPQGDKTHLPHDSFIRNLKRLGYQVNPTGKIILPLTGKAYNGQRDSDGIPIYPLIIDTNDNGDEEEVIDAEKARNLFGFSKKRKFCPTCVKNKKKGEARDMCPNLEDTDCDLVQFFQGNSDHVMEEGSDFDENEV